MRGLQYKDKEGKQWWNKKPQCRDINIDEKFYCIYFWSSVDESVSKLTHTKKTHKKQGSSINLKNMRINSPPRALSSLFIKDGISGGGGSSSQARPPRSGTWGEGEYDIFHFHALTTLYYQPI